MHDAFGEFVLAVQQDCFLCNAIWDRMKDGIPGPWKPLPTLWSPVSYWVQSDSHRSHWYRLTIDYPGLLRAGSGGVVSYRLVSSGCMGFILPAGLFSYMKADLDPSGDPNLVDTFLDVNLDASTASPSSLKIALAWNQNCHGHHSSCNEYAGRGSKLWLPTRLIDIGQSDAKHWKLCTTATDIDKTCPLPQYLALSYRWGPNPSLLLLNSTFADFRRGMLISQLPKTFQDLVVVARNFAIRYVWIDALCIIQDSTQDWDAEAPTMRMVYSSSACTIAASASSDETGGLFRPRDATAIRAGLVALKSPNSETRSFHIFERNYWDRNINRGPLHKRGWVFQERHLSCRIIYFTGHQIMFECLEGARCEAFPDGIPYHVSDKGLDPLWNFAAEKHRSSPGTSPSSSQECLMPNHVYLAWRDLVKKYANCSFTKTKDKLPAFAGIAKLFQEITGDEYFAGLWKSRLIEGLDWRVYAPEFEQPEEYRAPSWSWASLDGPFKPSVSGDFTQYLVNVVDVKVQPRGSDPTGAILGAHIKVQGALVRGSCTQLKSDGQCVLSIGSHAVHTHLFLDRLNTKLHNGDFVHCLPLTSEIPFDGTSSQTTEVFCLILTPALVSKQVSYRRIGHFVLDDINSLACFGFASDEDGLLALDSAKRLQHVTII